VLINSKIRHRWENWRRRLISRTQAGRVGHWVGLGAAQQPPKSIPPKSVSANAVAAHLIQVAKAPHDKKLMKLAGSTWGASANTMRSSALALCYSPLSGHALLTQVRCSWTLPCVSSLVISVLHISHGFQCSPTLNRQPYEGRLPLTSWWRKSSNMTIGQSSLIYLAHHCYDWHPGSRCG